MNVDDTHTLVVSSTLTIHFLEACLPNTVHTEVVMQDKSVSILNWLACLNSPGDLPLSLTWG